VARELKERRHNPRMPSHSIRAAHSPIRR
jgi:hypothetical protein